MTTRRKILTAVAAVAAPALAQRPEITEARDTEAVGCSLDAIADYLRDPTRGSFEMTSVQHRNRRVIRFTVVLNDPDGW